MIRVTKEEANYIRERAKNVRITITGKHKSGARKKRYADETYETFKLLRQYNAELQKRAGGQDGRV